MQSNFQTQASSNSNNHIQQLRDCLNNLCERSFWQYARFYGILARNFGHDRIRALTMLLSIYETNEKSAQQLILYLRKASWTQEKNKLPLCRDRKYSKLIMIAFGIWFPINVKKLGGAQCPIPSLPCVSKEPQALRWSCLKFISDFPQ